MPTPLLVPEAILVSSLLVPPFLEPTLLMSVSTILISGAILVTGPIFVPRTNILPGPLLVPPFFVPWTILARLVIVSGSFLSWRVGVSTAQSFLLEMPLALFEALRGSGWQLCGKRLGLRLR